MKRHPFFCVMCFLALAAVIALPSWTSAQIRKDPRMNQWVEYQGYFGSIGGYYGFPLDQVIAIRELGITENELPLVFFIASRRHIAPLDIAHYRLAHHPWLDVSRHWGLGPEAYYFAAGNFGQTTLPNGRLHGYFRAPREQWGQFNFADEDLVYLSNVGFLSEYYHVPPGEVIGCVGSGNRFFMADRQFRESQAKPEGQKKKYSFEEK